MALWAYIPAKHLEAVGSLPQSARRLDTGHLINDLPGVNLMWARACGWWNLDTLDENVGLLVSTNELTADELEALTEEVVDALAERQRRHNLADLARQRWAVGKDQGQDRLDLVEPYVRPERPAVPMNATNAGTWIAYLEQNDLYLDNWVRFIQTNLIGGGTTDTPGIGDLLMLVAQAVTGLLDQVDGIELPE
jgi:hypothetical protein